jgi:arylsulfatase A-like enzyme
MSKLFLSKIWVLLTLHIGLCFCSQAQNKFSKPNIIIIYADDLGYGDLSTYGGDIPSPNIQRIADAGIKFTDFYVSAPVCSPSRFSLLTGSYPQRSKHNILTASMPGDTQHIDKSEILLPEVLKQTGYKTGIFGKWHLGANKKEDFPTYHGFDTFVGLLDGCVDYFKHGYASLNKSWFKNTEPLEEEGFATDLITHHALNFIENNKNTPYFMFLAYNAPHYGKSDPNILPDSTVVLNQTTFKGLKMANTLQAPPQYLSRFKHISDPYRQIYAAMVSNLDDNIGRVLDVLQKEGSLENTMIWFISDNGGYSQSHFAHARNGIFKGEKQQLYEGGIRVPAVMCWQKRVKPRQIISQPLCNIDIMPTLSAITGTQKYLDKTVIDGLDVSKVLFKGKTLERHIYWAYKPAKQFAFRSGNWKLLNDALYNLEQDPSEKTDVAAQNIEKYNTLKALWEKQNVAVMGGQK